MNENTEIIAEPENDDPILPDGWTEKDDIFAEESWSGGAEKADEPIEAPEQENTEGAEEQTGETPTTESDSGAQDESEPGSEETAPTTEQESEIPGHKLKFKARVDRNDLDVEVDESELPNLYQKAQAMERYQAKLEKAKPQLEKAERLARAMGYDTVDAMLSAAETNYRDTEVARLVGEGVHEEVAKDMVARRIRDRETAPFTSPADQTQSLSVTPKSERDFRAEVSELFSARNDLSGKPIPSEVVDACVKGGKRLIVAYTEYEGKQTKAENERLERENKVLKQNAAAAARAPVSGVSGGGVTDTKPKDDFLAGFESDDY